MNCIPITELIASLQLNLGLASNQHETEITEWIYDALIEIGVQYAYCEETDLIKVGADCRIEKPANYVASDKIAIQVSKGCCVEPVYDKEMKCCVNTNDCCHEYKVSETPKYLVFSSNVEGLGVRLSYHAAPLGTDGMPIVPSTAKQAVWAYVVFMYTSMRRLKHGSGSSRSNPVALSEVAMYERRWLNMRAQAEARMVSGNYRSLLEAGNAMLYHISKLPSDLQVCVTNFHRESKSCACG